MQENGLNNIIKKFHLDHPEWSKPSIQSGDPTDPMHDSPYEKDGKIARILRMIEDAKVGYPKTPFLLFNWMVRPVITQHRGKMIRGQSTEKLERRRKKERRKSKILLITNMREMRMNLIHLQNPTSATLLYLVTNATWSLRTR